MLTAAPPASPAHLDGLLTHLAARSGADLVHLEHLAPRRARHGRLDRPLPPAVADTLARHLGPEGLWTHQAQAIDLARSGCSVAVATGTASGKSLCYQVPIAEAASAPVRSGAALALFPTKALAQDQLRALGELDLPGVVGATYDGDTDPAMRSWVRAHANTVLTNPDMLHVGVLPHHARWATFLMRLRYVVVDELHVFRGIFGSHVAHLLRRLRRLCAHYGSAPTFVFTSATIGEPARLASALCGLDVETVTDDGSPRGERLVALWNPAPLPAPGGHGVAVEDAAPAAAAGSAPARRSTHREAAEVTAELIAGDHRTIAFCRSRKGTEVVAAEVGRRLPAELSGAVAPYRGGYLAAERRAIEAELFGGRLRGVVATSALELGVDVGGLDACVMAGFPGTIASLWQQAGRAGRSQEPSAAVLVAGDDQLDQWLLAHPTEVFTRPPEPAVINPTNLDVALGHLACAAFERPLSHDDAAYWPDILDDAVRRLVLDDKLKVRTRTPRHRAPTSHAYWSGRGFPSHGVGLRTGSDREYRIVTVDGVLVGTVDEGRAFAQVHPGATYLHHGRAWRVQRLDLDDLAAWVEPTDDDTHTRARTDTDLAVLATDAHRVVGRATLHLGAVEVTSRVTAYQRLDVVGGQVLERVELDLPATALTTRAFWYTVDPEVLAAADVGPEDAPGTLHAAEHAAIGILPLFTICDRWDVGGLSTPCLEGVGQPAVVIYDGYPGGAGIAELGYETGERHLRAALDVIASCRCEAGCPSCVQSPKCGNGNDPLDKAGAVRLLRAILAPV